MAYTKINWIDNETKLVAANFNAMENGIAAAASTADNAKQTADSAMEEIGKTNEEISKLSGELDGLVAEVDKIDISFKDEHDGRLDALETALDGEIDSHINSTGNPHSVTAADVGAYAKNETYTKEEVQNLIQGTKDEILETQEFISCGTEDPGSTTTGTFYFKYAT